MRCIRGNDIAHPARGEILLEFLERVGGKEVRLVRDDLASVMEPDD